MLKFNNYTYTLQFDSYTKMVTVKNLFLRSFSRKSKKLAEISRLFGKKEKLGGLGGLNSDRLVTAAKGLLKLPNMQTLVRQKSLSLSQILAVTTLGELQR